MEILKRADVPQEFTWDLTPVFANDDAWFAEYEALTALPERIAESTTCAPPTIWPTC